MFKQHRNQAIIDLSCFQKCFFFFYVRFSNPTSPPGVHMGLVKCRVQCVPPYTLSSPTFKGVTRRMDLKHTSTDTFPLPMFPEVFVYRFGGAKGANSFLNLLKIYFCTIFCTFLNLLEKNQEFVPQALKQAVNLSCFFSYLDPKTMCE